MNGVKGQSHAAMLPPRQVHATTEYVRVALEEAGCTLLALPQSGPSTRLRQSGLEWVRDAASAYPPGRTQIRPAVPSASAIDRMDRVLAWIPRIPVDKFVLRRIVGARCLINPATGRYLFSWRRLGMAIGADHKAVQRWHAQGLDLIVAALNAREGRSVPPKLSAARPPRSAVNARS